MAVCPSARLPCCWRVESRGEEEVEREKEGGSVDKYTEWA